VAGGAKTPTMRRNPIPAIRPPGPAGSRLFEGTQAGIPARSIAGARRTLLGISRIHSDAKVFRDSRRHSFQLSTEVLGGDQRDNIARHCGAVRRKQSSSIRRPRTGLLVASRLAMDGLRRGIVPASFEDGPSALSQDEDTRNICLLIA